jgi:hypothetical protein
MHREGSTILSTSIRTRYRAALAASAVLAAAVTGAASASAATTGPTAPDELFNGYQHCSTDISAPTYLWGTDGVTLEGIPRDAAAAAGTNFGAQYLLWPVSAPTQTTTYSSYTSFSAGFEAPANAPGSALADGTTYAWQARTIIDGTTLSKWSKTCYIAIDDDRPAVPTVTSANYPAGQWSPGGVPVQLTFGANGVSDVAGYEYVWDTGVLPVPGVSIGAYGIPEPKSIWADTKYFVQAPSLGGDASLNLVPPSGAGPHTLTVASLDRAYNISATVTYQIYVRSTAPTVTTAVASPQFDTPTKFTLTPNATAEAASPIVSYSVSIGGGTPRVVKAGADGSATVTLRLNNVEGDNGLAVTSTSANGWVSDPYELYYYFDTTPIVNSNDYPEYATSGGVGVPGTFTFTAQVPNIVSYTYSFDNGATETTVAADKSGNAQITWAPPTGANSYDLNVYGTTKDGLTLLYTDYYFSVN